MRIKNTKKIRRWLGSVSEGKGRDTRGKQMGGENKRGKKAEKSKSRRKG